MLQLHQNVTAYHSKHNIAFGNHNNNKAYICDSVCRESEKTKLLISQQTQKVVEKEAETERIKAVIGESSAWRSGTLLPTAPSRVFLFGFFVNHWLLGFFSSHRG